MPRKEAKIERNVCIAQVNGYHHGNHENYLVFASDRPNKADSTYHLEDGTLPKMYGIEWETQNWGITKQTIYANLLRDVVFQGFHKDLWKIEEDSSLRRGCDSSAECITQPMTRAYIRNHYRDFKAMWKRADAFGISCDRTGQCGMHIHISNSCFGRDKKTQDDAIRKFLYIVNKHYNLMVSLFYRNESVTHYCGRMDEFADINNCKNTDLNDFWDSHGVCINMGHYAEGNIELRLVGGQKNYACFRNTLECVFHLVDAVKTLSWKECDSITAIFKGCNNYVYDRLSSYVRQNGHISDSELMTINQSLVSVEYI